MFQTHNRDEGTSYLFCFISIQLHSQNVGIGTTNPGADLEIVGDNNSAALFWDEGKASLRHHYNALTWERSIFNMFLDANNDQTDASFSIFTNSFTDVGLPRLKFDLEQGDSWIATNRLAINHTAPTNTLDVILILYIDFILLKLAILKTFFCLLCNMFYTPNHQKS